jgi:CheY-like chemotaxis protein
VAPDVPGRILGDPTRLRQVLINLLGNAIKFTESGRVAAHVEIETPDNGRDSTVVLRFSVSDTGIGIPKHKLASIFHAFQQADGSTTRRFGGTGLGLSISTRLVSLMGGTMEVESTPGRGSTFRFTCRFGIVRDSTERVPPSMGDSPGTAPRAGKSSLSILVAEDNRINQRLVQRLLERSGHTVELAENGEQALALHRQGSFDVVLMDVQMPVMDGLEATREIRKAEASDGSYTPIIAMTAFAMEGDKERCIEAGMDGYVSKPLNPAEFNRALLEATRLDPSLLGAGTRLPAGDADESAGTG